jgi:hypothetical protein
MRLPCGGNFFPRVFSKNTGCRGGEPTFDRLLVSVRHGEGAPHTWAEEHGACGGGMDHRSGRSQGARAGSFHETLSQQPSLCSHIRP